MTRQMSNVVVVCNVNERNVSLLASFIYASNAFIYELKTALCAFSLLFLSRIHGFPDSRRTHLQQLINNNIFYFEKINYNIVSRTMDVNMIKSGFFAPFLSENGFHSIRMNF